MNDFLPQGYTIAQGNGDRYLKLSAGDTRFRILSNPILGSVVWTESPEGGRKPLRFRLGAPIPKGLGEGGPKGFWAMTVWHEERVKILELTQKSLQLAIQTLTSGEDWKDPKQYDIIINRQGTTLNDTRYSLTPCPAKPLSAEAMKVIAATPVELERLFDGENPFEGGLPFSTTN